MINDYTVFVILKECSQLHLLSGDGPLFYDQVTNIKSLDLLLSKQNWNNNNCFKHAICYLIFWQDLIELIFR